MLEKFNGISYLVVFLVHFIGFAYYGFRCVFQTQSFLNQYGMLERMCLAMLVSVSVYFVLILSKCVALLNER